MKMNTVSTQHQPQAKGGNQMTASTLSTSTQTAPALKSNLIQFPLAPAPAAPKAPRTITSTKPHEAVEPIRDRADIEAAKQYFLTRPEAYQKNATNLRNYMMFVVNINNACRISDFLQLRIGDILTSSGAIRDEVFIREGKTGKTRYIFFGPASKEAILMYLNALPSFSPDDYLVASRKHNKDGSSKPITRQQAWGIISRMGKAISENRDKPLHLGTHSMRKTFGYQKVAAHPDDQMILARISEIYNHSSLAMTYKYLGLDTDEKRDLCISEEL